MELAGRREPLDKLIAEDPGAILGQAANARFAAGCLTCSKFLTCTRCSRFRRTLRLPRPAKALLARTPRAFALKQRRNYKDDNHKPEIGVALTEFWMLHGFRPLEQIAETFARLRAGRADAGLSPKAGGCGARSCRPTQFAPRALQQGDDDSPGAGGLAAQFPALPAAGEADLR